VFNTESFLQAATTNHSVLAILVLNQVVVLPCATIHGCISCRHLSSPPWMDFHTKAWA
jgi:hypothetical protein